MTIEQRLKHYRLSTGEYDRMKTLLGREPNDIEWPLFSALWSEHCSYKSSKIHLKKFSYRNASTRDDSDENAGVVDFGYGEKIIFKMESHNHPSFIEPFQGAATGVGGILRDIFTMGARPIAVADFLCFGHSLATRMEYLAKEVVHGISSYGNCVGVPNITGYTEYDSSYNENILVNAMAVGLIQNDQVLASSRAEGVGNWVIYVGAKTGKDGVHGAAMASESFDDEIEKKKPNIQIGDPFLEKLLIESCLEVLKEKLVVAMQDMGAAGLTSSSFEMAAKGNVGMELDLSRVPLRDSTMSPEEILLSESQERMLLVCEPKNFKRIHEIFQKWGLDACSIGTIIPERKMKLVWKNRVLTDIDPNLITEQAPRYDRAFERPIATEQKDWAKYSEQSWIQNLDLKKIRTDSFFSSKNWIYQQYDQRVGGRTMMDAGHTVGVLKLPSGRSMALSVGCRPAFVRLDARIGILDSVFYPVLQQAAKGYKTMALTDCLNFASPENPKIMGEFVLSCDLLAEAARILDAPIISGNVSFYNETKGKPITSTPAIGAVGLREDQLVPPCCHWQDENWDVFLIQFQGIQSFSKIAEISQQKPAFVGDLNMLAFSDFVQDLRCFIVESKPKVSRVVGQGGLALTLEKMKTSKFKIDWPQNPDHILNSKAMLFEERLYDIIVGCDRSEKETFQKQLDILSEKHKLTVHYLGLTHESV